MPSALSAVSTEEEIDVVFSPSVAREEEELGVVSPSGAASEEEDSTGKSALVGGLTEEETTCVISSGKVRAIWMLAVNAAFSMED